MVFVNATQVGVVITVRLNCAQETVALMVSVRTMQDVYAKMVSVVKGAKLPLVAQMDAAIKVFVSRSQAKIKAASVNVNQDLLV